jgi:hypothetical protein
MLLVSRTCWLPKRGHTPAEYEDAFAGPVDRAGMVMAAVADGATETAFAGVWARALVEAFTESPPPASEGVGETVVLARRRFDAAVTLRLPALPWYAAAKAEEGAHAALLGLALRPEGRYGAWSVGDCCLMHRRNERTIETWPFERPEEFSNRPVLLGSRAGESLPPVASREGRWKPGDVFWLVTDALAAYLLGRDSATAPGLDAFEAFVESARADGMRNDDVTFLQIEIAGA